jgi:hypothetical protein
MLIIIINRSKACESQMPKAKSPGAKSKIERIFKILFLSFIFILDILSFFNKRKKSRKLDSKIPIPNSSLSGFGILNGWVTAIGESSRSVEIMNILLDRMRIFFKNFNRFYFN